MLALTEGVVEDGGEAAAATMARHFEGSWHQLLHNDFRDILMDFINDSVAAGRSELQAV